MSNPIWAMLIGVGVGLAVSLYMYYQDQRANTHSYGSNNDRGGSSTSRLSNQSSRHNLPRNSRNRNSPDARKEPCMICLDDKSRDHWRILPCNHCFHVQCIDLWFNEKRTCPTCRTDVSSYWA